MLVRFLISRDDFGNYRYSNAVVCGAYYTLKSVSAADNGFVLFIVLAVFGGAHEIVTLMCNVPFCAFDSRFARVHATTIDSPEKL